MTAHKATLIFIVLMLVYATPSVIGGDKKWIRDIPSDRSTWNLCCGHEDCQESKRIRVSWLGEFLSMVYVEDYAPFVMPNKDIHRSLNGKVYFCRIDIDEPPSDKNILCVFIGMSLT